MEKNECLLPITVRFTVDAMDAIETIAKVHGKSKAEVVRLVVDNRLINYLSKCIILEHGDAEQVISVLGDTLSEMQSIKGELRRIGRNYNRALKLKEIERKMIERSGDVSATLKLYDEKEKLLKEEGPLEPEKLEKLMARYERATQEAGEVLCRILG